MTELMCVVGVRGRSLARISPDLKQGVSTLRERAAWWRAAGYVVRPCPGPAVICRLTHQQPTRLDTDSEAEAVSWLVLRASALCL